jgi:hypothetical protein
MIRRLHVDYGGVWRHGPACDLGQLPPPDRLAGDVAAPAGDLDQ